VLGRAAILRRFLLIAASLLLPWMTAHASRSSWREMTIGQFHLISTLSDSKTRDIARHVQAFEQTVGSLLRKGEPLPPVPTLICVLGGHDYQRFASPRSGTAGFFSPRTYDNLIVINGDLDFDEVVESVYHEYAHYIQSSSSTANLPPWYVEGYAELFSTFKMKDLTISLGDVPQNVRLNMDDWIPIERLLAVKDSDPEYRAESLAPQFYAESWILAHMLLFDNKDFVEPTVRYLANMDIGLTESEAFAKSFSFSKADLDKTLKQLIRKRSIRIKRLTYAKPPTVQETAVTPVTAGQAALWLARVGFESGRSREVLQPLLNEAQASAESRVAALALEARVSSISGTPIELSKLMEPLRRGGIDEPQIRIDLAHALLADGREDHAAAAAVLGDLAGSAEAPIEAVGLWSEAALNERIDPSRIRTVLDAALRRAPDNTRLLQYLAAALEMMGDKPAAKAAYGRIILVSHDPQERLWAQKQADSARLRTTR
jgi:hypothetical protein